MFSIRSKRGTSLAEFGPTMWCFFLLVLIPLVDLGSFLLGVGTVMLLADISARKVAGARTYTEAINIMNSTEDEMKGFRAVAQMSPTGGLPRGVKIQVVSNSTSGGSSTTYTPPPVPNKIPVDRTTLDSNVYNYQVTASYDVAPLFNFKNLGWFSTIPGLGKDVPVVYTSSCVVEHPNGLND